MVYGYMFDDASNVGICLIALWCMVGDVGVWFSGAWIMV